MYKKCFAQRLKGNQFLIHLWEDTGYSKVEWTNQAYIECPEDQSTHIGLNGESLKKISNWKPDNTLMAGLKKTYSWIEDQIKSNSNIDKFCKSSLEK